MSGENKNYLLESRGFRCMKQLCKAAGKFLLFHKTRHLFLIIGVTLGVALIIAIQVLIASIEASNEIAIKEQYGDYDLVVGYQTAEKSVSAGEIEEMENLESVEKTTRFLYPYLDKESEMNMLGELIYAGFENEELAFEYPVVSLAKGAFPQKEEVLVSSQYAKQHQLEIGSTVKMKFPPNGTKEVTISGFTVDNQALSNMAIFDYEWLQEATSNENHTTAVIIQLDNHENKQMVINQLRQINPDFFIDSRSEIDKERENIGGIGPVIQGLNIAIYLVSALIIISTMRMSVQEKQKELATLRILGFERKHIYCLVLIESLILGFISLVAGLIIGILLPVGALDLFIDRMNVGHGVIIFPWSDLLMNLGIFSLVILFSSLVPAYQASLAPPVVAYRGSTKVQALSKRYTVISIAISLVTAVVYLINVYFIQSKSMFVINGVLFIVCAFTSIPLMFAFSVTLLDWIAKFIRIPVEFLIAARNLLRQLNRNVQLSAIFTIGIVITVIGMVILTTIKDETTDIIKENNPNDLRVISVASELAEGFPYSFYEKVEKDPDIEAFYYTNEVVFLIENLPPNKRELSEVVLGISGTDLQHSFDSGSIKTNGLSTAEEMSENGVMLTEQTAEEYGYNIGDTIIVNVSEDFNVLDEKEFVVEGIITDTEHIGDADYHFFTTRENMKAMFGIDTLYQVEMNILHGDKKEKVKSIQSLLQDPAYSNTILYSRAEELAELEQQFLQRVFLLYLAVAMMIIFTVIGLMNSTASSIKERLKELSMLRVLGSTKKRLLSLLLMEGALLTTTAGVLAIGLSTLSAYCFIQGLDANTFAVLPKLLLGLFFLSPLIGLGAVLIPALWATRLDLMKGMRE